MKHVIGIISYLPDDIKIREERIVLIKNLINQCKVAFPNTHILIVAQNWKDFTVENATIYAYQKLGINGARQTLKNIFLNSSYDNLIMMDDDCILNMDLIDGKLMLKEIEDNPSKALYFAGRWLKLFSIPKSLYSQIEDFGNKVDEVVIISGLNELNKKYGKSCWGYFKYPYRQSRTDIINPLSTSTYREDERLKYFNGGI